MATHRLQRTFLIGLGPVGAGVVDRLLAELAGCEGPVPPVQGLVILAGEEAAPHLDVLRISPEADFAAWQTEFEQAATRLLYRISRLENLPSLAGQNTTDEIHLIVAANLAQPWTEQMLAPLVESLAELVYRTLACYASLSGLLFFIPPQAEALVNGESPETAAPPAEASPQPEAIRELAALFDRGCFLASLTNEVGLVVGDVPWLIEGSARFLMLCILQDGAVGPSWSGDEVAGWGTPLTSFGLARVQWPGPALVEILSNRWTQQMLAHLATPPQGQTSGQPEQQARAAGQQMVTAARLTPPALLDQLAALMPPLPHHLATLVPDPPWPWLLVDTQSHLEQAGQRWQETWLADRRDRLTPALAELETAWPVLAENWLRQVAAGPRPGVLLRLPGHMAAMTELLQAFGEGVAHNLAEVEADLNRIDRQLGELADTLANAVETFPTTPLLAALRWGLRPIRWLHYWARCRQAQKTAYHFAHLTRNRLLVLQSIWLYEELLPFYDRLQTAWQQVVDRWQAGCREITEAGRQPALQNWPAALDELLANTTGPWRRSLVQALYQETMELHVGSIWEQIGTVSDWIEAGMETDALLDRLRQETNLALTPTVNIPADQALIRALPHPPAQAEWLVGLAEQARPFWRYDETLLAEKSRAQVRLQTWLLLPGGEESPLPRPELSWSQPPRRLISHCTDEIILVAVRQVYSEGGVRSVE